MDNVTQRLVELPHTIIRKSFGLPLVLLGFMLVYSKGTLHPSDHLRVGDYLIFTFSAAVTIVGLAFMAVELRRVGGVTELESAVTSSDLELTIKQLAKNLDINRGQASQGFVAALILMVMGICVVLAGALGDLFGSAVPNSRLTTVAGIVVEVVSGLGLVLFKTTFSRLNRTSDSLLELWKLLAAFKRAEDLPENERVRVQIYLIGRLVEGPRSSIDVPLPGASIQLKSPSSENQGSAKDAAD